MILKKSVFFWNFAFFGFFVFWQGPPYGLVLNVIRQAACRPPVIWAGLRLGCACGHPGLIEIGTWVEYRRTTLLHHSTQTVASDRYSELILQTAQKLTNNYLLLCLLSAKVYKRTVRSIEKKRDLTWTHVNETLWNSSGYIYAGPIQLKLQKRRDFGNLKYRPIAGDSPSFSDFNNHSIVKRSLD